MKIKELKYGEFLDLLDFIEENFKGDDNYKMKVLLVLRKFIPKLDGFALILLMNLIEDRKKETFDAFLEVAGEGEFDPTGKSEPEESDFTKVNLDMLELITETELKDGSSQSVKRKRREALAAKNLKPLKEIKLEGKYSSKKRAYLRRTERVFTNDEFLEFEDALKSLHLNHEKIVERVIDYISGRSIENGRLFFEHMSTRLAACVADLNFSDQRNTEYMENLKEISK